eukprot:m.160817 g.160817  ORF g.160817 m.160817 type:complete len:165 (-) comp17630_c0_seq10:74-568(-)
MGFFADPLKIGLCGVAGAVIAFCVYFDQQRRSDPNFKEKLREKRRRAKERKAKKNVLDISDPESVKRFFMQEMQLAQTAIETGNVGAGVHHFANAVQASSFTGQGQGHSQQLLSALQQMLEPQVFMAVIEEIRTRSQQSQQGQQGRPQGQTEQAAPTNPITELD